MNKLKLFYPFLLTLFLAGGVFIGTKINGGFTGTKGSEQYNKIRDIINILDKDYVDSVNTNDLFKATINDMLHRLDPHSAYIPAEELQQATERVNGVFGGIGVRFFLLRDTIAITNVIPNSPSLRAGLKAGDKIIKVEGKTVAGKKISNEEIMKMLKGHPGTVVNVTILRNGKLFPIRITRGIIPLSSVSAYYMLDKNIGYLKLDEFSKTTPFEFDKAVSLLKQYGMQKFVLDLRNNGGGVLESAIRLADEFLPEGKLIVSTKGKNYPEEKIYATRNGELEKMPVVVLINESSASASEVLSGALQDNDRATIVGRRSFGKGLVQQDIPLADGSDLRLVVARYYTPTGRSIQRPYNGDYEQYMKDFYNRFDDGELFHRDTVKVADSLKYHTPKGKVVYGGGGIYPDVFIPLDSTLNSMYVAEFYYRGVFQSFAFEFVKDKRSKWSSMYDYKKNFTVNDVLVQQFLAYFRKNYKDVHYSAPTKFDIFRIKEVLKAEIARQLWEEVGYFYVGFQEDRAVEKAIQILSKN